MAGFTFEQIKLNANENLTNSVLNRALMRLWKNIEDLKSSSSIAIPEATANETTFLVDTYDSTNQTHIKQWKTFTKFSDFVPYPKLTELTDISTSIPLNGQTIVWNKSSGTTGMWQFKALPAKIQDFNDFKNVDDNPLEGAVLTYTTDKKWVAQTMTQFIGVGYIYHQVVNSPSVIKLPTSSTALAGSEQVVITKIIPDNAGDNDKFPILITTGNSNIKIINKNSITTNNDDEDFASIHLRACQGPDGNYIWIPVCATGTWYPSDNTDISTSEYNSTQNKNTYILTENQIKLQPYNIDINFALDGSDISKNYDIILEKNSEGIWKLSTSSSTGVNYQGNGLFSINHNILDGVKAVKTTVYYSDSINGKLIQVIPDEVYFPLATESFATLFVNLNSWLDLDDTLNSLTFKIVVSI